MAEAGKRTGARLAPSERLRVLAMAGVDMVLDQAFVHALLSEMAELRRLKAGEFARAEKAGAEGVLQEARRAMDSAARLRTAARRDVWIMFAVSAFATVFAVAGLFA